MHAAEIVAGGLLRGGYLVPFFLAMALVARHGRYLPLWLPQAGAISAYLTFLLVEKYHTGPLSAVCIGVAAATTATVLLHRLLFQRHVVASEPYPALLRGLAAVLFLESLLGLLTGGYALSYEALTPRWKTYVGWPVQDTLRIPDLVALGSAFLLAPLLRLLIERTSVGLSYRAVSSNRELAIEYRHPVAMIDHVVVLVGGILSAAAGITYALRYGLTPQMLTAPSLDVVAVVVAVGSERLLAGSLAVLGVGVTQALCQASPRYSNMEHAVSYVLLVTALVLLPVVRHSWEHMALFPEKRAA